jgi:hypothetical protein
MVITSSACAVKNWFLHLRIRLAIATPHRTVQTDHLVTSRFNFEVHNSILLLPPSFLYSYSSLLCAFPLFYSSPSTYPAIFANSPVFPTFIVQISFPSSSSTCGLSFHSPCLFLFLLSFTCIFLQFRAHFLSCRGKV